MVFKSCLSALLTLSFSFSHGQTCVIAKISKDGIYLGADSRFAVTNELGGDTLRYTGCKITTVKNVSFAVAGFNGQDQINLVKQAMSTSLSLDTFPKIYASLFTSYLKSYLVSLRSKDSLKFIQFIKNTQPRVSQTIFCGYENGKPSIRMAIFMIDNSPPYYDITFQVGWDTVAIAGDVNEIKSLCRRNSTYKKGIKEGIIYQMQIAMKAHRCEVGYPIDIIKITPLKVDYLTPKRNCSFIRVDCN